MEAEPVGTTFADLEALFADGRFAAAAELAARLQVEAAQRGDAAAANLALIREVQAEVGLGATEKALRLLLAAPAPTGRREKLLLELFRGETLSRYYDTYSWEIGQREKIRSADPLDLSKWSASELNAAILQHFAAAWEERASWGTESVAPLAGLVEQNDYPARIRGTLRDTLSYLFAEALGNSSRFQPAEANELYRLDLDALLAPAAASTTAEVVAPGQHPLERLRRVLADLEAWHLEAGRREAALEARLTLLDALRVHFTGNADRERFDRELETTLAAFDPGLEWRSMLLSRLAEWRRESEAPDAWKRAHQVALEGAVAFPDSIGGRRCRTVLDQLEAPNLSLDGVANDLPRRPSIVVVHSNLARLYFRAYRLPSATSNLVEVPFRADAKGLVQLVRSGSPVAEWQLELANPGDFRQHRTQVTPPLDQLGKYVILASERPDFALEQNRAQAMLLNLSEVMVLGRPSFRRLDTEVEVRAASNGRAVAGAQIELMAATNYGQDFSRMQQGSTDQQGLAVFDLQKAAVGTRFYLAVDHGASHLDTGDWLYRPHADEPADKISREQLVFSDRGIYRPGQKLFFKVISYTRNQQTGERRVENEVPVQVELLDANGEVVASQELKSNRHGSAAGEFLVPAGRLLGSWTLRAGTHYLSLRVEEYKRPTFEVELLAPASPLRLNQPAQVEGSARYFFGMPLREGKVTWRVTREPSYPRWWCWWTPIIEVQNVAFGEARLDGDGRFKVSFEPRADERLAATAAGREVAYLYRVHADLTDEGGETRSADRAFKVGFAAIDASLSAAAPFFGEGQPLEVAIRLVDLDGQGRAGEGSWRLVALAAGEAPLLPADLPLSLSPEAEVFALPGDRKRPRLEARYDPAAALRLLADGREIARGVVASDAQGEARLTLDPARFAGGLPAGFYRLRYRTADVFGGEVERQVELLVVGKNIPRLGIAAVLEPEKTRAEVGSKLRLVAGSGLAEVPAVVEIFRGEQRILRRELRPGEVTLIEQPVVAEDRGGLVVELHLVADSQLIELRRQIDVPLDEPRLGITYSNFRDRLTPGLKERFSLEVKSLDGSNLDPKMVEILAYMYDRSLDLFAPPARSNPFQSSSWRPQVLGLHSSIRNSWAFWRIDRGFTQTEYPQLRGDRLTFYDNVQMGGPGGGGYAGGPPMMRMMMSAPAPESAPPPAPQAPDDAPVVAALSSTGSLSLPGAESPPPPPKMRENFAETAFFEPHLEPGDDGRVSFEFTVPDSVTEWNVFTHALADDFRYASDQRTTRTVKDLQVRPYLPRFLREGDRAELRVSVDNTGEAGVFSGRLDFELVDPESGESLLAAFGIDPATASSRPFVVEPGHSAILRFPMQVPTRLGPVVLRVRGRTEGLPGGDLADGEQRLLPILPSRMHLAQSRFAVLSKAEKRTLTFEELRRDEDRSRQDEQLVVTLDGQLFTSVLRALPYLVDYPYRCTEQNLNRFVSTGILTSFFDRYPAIARLAQELASRSTPLEPVAAADPNRTMLLEETPWLQQSRGGDVGSGGELQKVLDPQVARAVREGAIAELRAAQDSAGGFPWWPGGPPSPFFTLLLLQGFAQAMEFGVEVPRDMIEKAWSYLRQELQPELDRLKEPKEMREAFYTITWLNYILSIYPDLSWTAGAFSAEDRERMLDTSLLYWKQLPPRTRLYLALTASRAGRPAEAKRLLESVMDSAKTSPDQGTYWLPEERAWLFYWDRIETHALALRTLAEIAPQDPRRHGLVVWLMLNKKLNQWSSTRSTAEVIYSLVAYLEAEGQLGLREEAQVHFGGKVENFVFEPDRDEGRRQLRLEGKDIEPARDAEVTISKTTPGLLFASATWQFSTEKLPQEGSGDFFAVERQYFRRQLKDGAFELEKLDEGARIAVGDEIEVQLTFKAKHQAEFVQVRDPRGAGFEPVDLTSGWRWDLGIGYYREIRDSATNFFFEGLPPGEYQLKYRLRAATAGSFRVGPATLQSMYAPEFAAYSAGKVLEIEP